jgi:hypothetical protein
MFVIIKTSKRILFSTSSWSTVNLIFSFLKFVILLDEIHVNFMILIIFSYKNKVESLTTRKKKHSDIMVNFI